MFPGLPNGLLPFFSFIYTKDSTMYRIGFAILVCLLWSCNGQEQKPERKKAEVEGNANADFSNRFRTATLPYQLADTDLLKNKDTTSVPLSLLSPLAQDTSIKKIFGKNTGIKYSALAKMEEKGKEAYYVLKAKTGEKMAGLLLVFDKSGNYGASLPFLVPDNDASTSQVSSIDRSYVVTKTTTERKGTEISGEGKEVVSYHPKEKRFVLELTDLLNDNPAVLVNPIDTFRKSNKWAGDYYLNKKNLVAVRDGRHPNQILVYIHTENSEGDCKGELKGEFLLTGSSSAVYRQGGDPCILGLVFSGNSVSINEESGCGNYRGLDCPLSGTFTRKKEEKPKEINKKKKLPKKPNSVTTTH